MSLELTGVHGLLKRHKLFTHKEAIKHYKNCDFIYDRIRSAQQCTR